MEKRFKLVLWLCLWFWGLALGALRADSVCLNNAPVPADKLWKNQGGLYLEGDYLLKAFNAAYSFDAQGGLLVGDKPFPGMVRRGEAFYLPAESAVTRLGGRCQYDRELGMLDIYTYAPQTYQPAPAKTPGSAEDATQLLKTLGRGDKTVKAKVEVKRYIMEAEYSGSIIKIRGTVKNRGEAWSEKCQIYCFFYNGTEKPEMESDNIPPLAPGEEYEFTMYTEKIYARERAHTEKMDAYYVTKKTYYYDNNNYYDKNNYYEQIVEEPVRLVPEFEFSQE